MIFYILRKTTEKKKMSYITIERQRQIQDVIDSIPALTNGISYPDNNLIDVAKALGIAEVIVEDMGDDSIDGVIAKSEDKAKTYIFINDSRPDSRKLFTLAHELGHYMLKHNGTNFRVDRQISIDNLYNNEEKDIYETEANFFAAALLMPERDVVNFLLSGVSTKDMASAFKVSEAAVRNRVKWVKSNSVALKGFFF